MQRPMRIIVVLILMGSVAVLGLPAVPAQGAGQTWVVTAGGLRDAVWSNAFHPRMIEVGVGDTVTWQFEGFHSVTFSSGQEPPPLTVREGDNTYFNPLIFFPAGAATYDGTGYRNSGVPPDDPTKFSTLSYSLTFTKTGTYKYQCAVHGPAMSGTIVVKDRATATPVSAAGQAKNEQAATMTAGQAAWAALKPESQGSAVVVPLSGDAKAGFSIVRYTRQPLVVKSGTTVTWTMRDPFEIHTVTFLGGEKVPDFIIAQPQKQGPPKLLLNPKVGAPTSSKTYDGTGYANSGILFPVGMPGNPPRSWSVTFTKPGRYDYVCVVHLPEGMKGTVIVQ